MLFGKIVNNSIDFCPSKGKDGNKTFHTNLLKYYEKHLDIAEKDGYCPVIYTKKPNGNYITSWEKQTIDGVLSIIQIWTQYQPEPEPISVDVEKLRADVDYIAMMQDIDLDGDAL